ncbi:uncharacterized protein B0H64DRAFT_67876 [Chaetomium fimeti]|uniref:Uncharacterized protein n=1 Tax=Chaetomium fimeti TaxID=1854472 RepID=A0AAE0HM46_9PEZI|nr:hypothetical protein B0H64DRAFT_67876 [Chaetomium fimeti]
MAWGSPDSDLSPCSSILRLSGHQVAQQSREFLTRRSNVIMADLGAPVVVRFFSLETKPRRFLRTYHATASCSRPTQLSVGVCWFQATQATLSRSPSATSKCPPRQWSRNRRFSQVIFAASTTQPTVRAEALKEHETMRAFAMCCPSGPSTKPAELTGAQNLAGDRSVAFLGMPGAQQGSRCQDLGAITFNELTRWAKGQALRWLTHRTSRRRPGAGPRNETSLVGRLTSSFWPTCLLAFWSQS